MKKVICLLIAFITFFTVTCYAASARTLVLSDVKGTKYEEAVNKLITFDIVNGFEDNTYRPAETVTRAQLAKMLVISMGMENQVADASKKYLDFSDVLSSHWGYGYIKLASDNKLVNGYEDKTFKPEGNVTYAEATAMIVRALGYEVDVARSDLSWPNNYMIYADEKLELFDGISTFKANDKANRGDIALLLWNALRTGVCEIVAENSKGLVYGPGTAMITEYLNYIYFKDAQVKEVVFDKNFKTAEVTFKEKGKDSVTIEFDAEDAIEMFGKTVSILCDKKGKNILSLEATSDYKTVKGNVSNVTSTKIYLTNKSTGYKLPDDDDILLYGIEDLEDAAEVILLVDGTTIQYCVAMGTSEVQMGVVVDAKVKISSDYGIKVRGIDVTKGGESYLLANDKNWPEKGEVILYYINDDDCLVVLGTASEEEASSISSVGSSSIKISKKQDYEFEDKDEYTIVTATSSKLKSTKLSEVSKKTDMVCILEYNAHVFIIVYEDAYLDNLDPDLVDALDALDEAIEEALDYDEGKYTQKSYAQLMKYVETGKSLDYDSTISKIKKATSNILKYIDNLEAAGAKERKVVSAKKTLRELVNDEAEPLVEDEDLYTKKSYNAFYEVYSEAIELLSATDAEQDELEDMYDDLEDAIDSLVKA